MHILLPPSETKRSGGGGIFSDASLAHTPELGAARATIRDALLQLCADPDAAAAALKLGAKSRAEILHNLALGTSGAMPAIERYTGVLYDALDVPELEPPARQWVDANVSVQSALFGLIAAGDAIPAYRLSASTRLPGLERPAKRLWRDAHAAIDWAQLGWVLDLRSKDYAELAPVPAGLGATLDVVQAGPDGSVRALNHFNKAAKGDLVRRLAASQALVGGADDLLAWAADEGLDLRIGESADRLTLVTALGAPKAAVPALAGTADAAR